jgi:hypothetical protein
VQVKIKLSTLLLAIAFIINVGELLIINDYLINQQLGWGEIPLAGAPWLLSLGFLLAGLIVNLTEKK